MALCMYCHVFLIKIIIDGSSFSPLKFLSMENRFLNHVLNDIKARLCFHKMDNYG